MIAGPRGGCIGIFIRPYCQRVGLPTEGLAVGTEFEYDDDDKPTRTTDLRVKVTLPENILSKRLGSLQKVADACIIHCSLIDPSRTEISLVHPASA